MIPDYWGVYTKDLQLKYVVILGLANSTGNITMLYTRILQQTLYGDLASSIRRGSRVVLSHTHDIPIYYRSCIYELKKQLDNKKLFE